MGAGWLVWGFRTIVAMVLVGGTGSTVSFLVADYVADRSNKGLSIAVQNLQGSINHLGETVRAIDQSLRNEIRLVSDQRQTLAVEIAREVALLQGTARTQDISLTDLRTDMRNGISRIESRLDKLLASSSPKQ
jgi:hypothetical protein